MLIDTFECLDSLNLRSRPFIMKHLIFLLTVLILYSCNGISKSSATINENDQIEVYSFEELEPMLVAEDERIHVVNFWATWCKPCIEELPYFEKLHENKNDQVKVLLVSLDFPNKLDSQLKPFVKNKNIRSQVVLLDDPHENVWIPKIDSSWTGAIPATLIFTKSKRIFYERSFTQQELNTEVSKFSKL